jgi:NADH-quinone oxidoreductase subunit F
MFPCREGTGWKKVLHRIENGQDVKKILICFGVQSKIEGNTICPLGDAASWPVAAAIRHFRDEFEYHVRFQKNKKQEPFCCRAFRKSI